MAAPATIVEGHGPGVRRAARLFRVAARHPIPRSRSRSHVAAVIRALDSAASVDFPYCRFCVAHVSRWESAAIMISGLTVIGVLALILAAIISEPALGFAILVALVLLALVASTSRRNQARRACRSSCGSVGKAVEYLGWSGITSGFAFHSIAYGAKFAEQNATRLVDDPRIRKLLQHYKLARIAVPTPATAVSVIPPPLTVGEWVARLAATLTRVARRHRPRRCARHARRRSRARATRALRQRDRARRAPRTARAPREPGRQAPSSADRDHAGPSRQRPAGAARGPASRARAAPQGVIGYGPFRPWSVSGGCLIVDR